MCYLNKNKKLVAVYFRQNHLLCKKGEKNNLSQGKMPGLLPPPPRISNGQSQRSRSSVPIVVLEETRDCIENAVI